MSEIKKEDWMQKRWRPAMGWLYMGICAFDFVICSYTMESSSSHLLKRYFIHTMATIDFTRSRTVPYSNGSSIGFNCFQHMADHKQEKLLSQLPLPHIWQHLQPAKLDEPAL
jgi:hypothetical protein